jgi:ADP-dependent phosphofructokinase/glucokinase
MRIFAALFAHWDSVIRVRDGFMISGDTKAAKPHSKLSEVAEVNYVLSRPGDSESLITGKLYSELRKLFPEREKRPGGNAANAAIALGELGTGCVLSCPARPKSLMMSLSNYPITLTHRGSFVSPLKVNFDANEFEHLCFEAQGYKKIFTYDTMTENCWLDSNFWDSVNRADLLYLCGFHLVNERHCQKIDYLADLLEDRNFRTHMELGRGSGAIDYAIKKLLEKNCIDSMGLSEEELELLGIQGDISQIRESAVQFLSSHGLERLVLHTRDYRLTVTRGDIGRSMKAAEYSRQVSAARTLGSISKNMDRAKSLPLTKVRKEKGRNFLLIPVYSNASPKAVVGLGDTSSIVDAMLALGE